MLGSLLELTREAMVNEPSQSVSSELMTLAQEKNFDEVLARFRDYPPEEVLRVADWLREEDIYNVAIELYQWLLDREESAAAHFGIGQCYGKIYEYGTALGHLDKAFEQDPDRSEGASYYAYILERHERMDDADHWYRQALDGAESDDLWARSHYAWFLEKWGRTDDACAAYEDVLKRNPSYTWAVKRYALLLHELGKSDRARTLLRDAVERAPQNRFAALNYLEFLLLTDDDRYVEFRASLEPTDAPDWYPVVIELYDYYREHLLPSSQDPARLVAFKASADALTDSVHRDFDDLTALLSERGGDVETWRQMIQALLK
jgi:tetratricopeptide (TPR) repeat protein